MFVVVRERVVYHYGNLLIFSAMTGPRNWLFEGDTLSVSLCPSEWLMVNPALSPTDELYAIEREDEQPANFIDLARLTKANRDHIDTWATSHGLGTFAAPDLNALTTFHGTAIPASFGGNAILIAWAKDWAKGKDVDGIWFCDPIDARWPDTSRGGIFQDRLHLFQRKAIATVVAPAVWPPRRNPQIELW